MKIGSTRRREGAKERLERLMYGETLSPEIERVASAIVHALYRVHVRMGAGMLESVYEACVAHELRKAGFKVDRQKPCAIIYDEIELDEGFRLDLLVNDCVIVEIKAVEKIMPVHQAQLKTYLRLTGLELGILVNFNVPLIKDGVQRIILSANKQSNTGTAF